MKVRRSHTRGRMTYAVNWNAVSSLVQFNTLDLRESKITDQKMLFLH